MARLNATARFIAPLLLVIAAVVAEPANAWARCDVQSRLWGSAAPGAVRTGAEAGASAAIHWVNAGASTVLSSGSTNAPKGGANPFIGKSRDSLLKSKASYEKLITEHRAKLEAFKRDPIGNSSAEWLRQATRDNPSREVLLQRASGRIPALEKQLFKQEGELGKVLEALR